MTFLHPMLRPLSKVSSSVILFLSYLFLILPTFSRIFSSPFPLYYQIWNCLWYLFICHSTKFSYHCWVFLLKFSNYYCQPTLFSLCDYFEFITTNLVIQRSIIDREEIIGMLNIIFYGVKYFK